MKDYRFFANVLLMVFCSCLTGCNKKASTSDKVKTGKAIEITAESVVLAGKVNVDIKDYNSVEFGMMISDNLQDMNNRKGDKGWSRTLIGNNYTIELDGLMESTKYYYCAFVFLNKTQYEFGAIKDFTTPEVVVEKKEAFSVSTTKQVRFSPGNLQYTRSTQTWSFAEHQYDIIGKKNVNGSDLADKIDLFGWSGRTAIAKWGISTSTDCIIDYRGDFVDWGMNTIGTDAPNTWRTLTDGERYYLFYLRTNADNLVGVACIQLDENKYVNGLVLLPDDWTCPAGITFKSGFANERSVQAYADYQTYTLSDWRKLEFAGAVFLPASGYRDGAYVSLEQYNGNYWSATPGGSERAYCLNFLSAGAYRASNFPRYSGQAIRLVQDVQ